MRGTLLTMSEDEFADAQPYKGLIEGNDLGYQRDLGCAFMKEVKRAVTMTHTGDTCLSVHQVMASFLSVLQDSDGAGELKTRGGCRRGIGQALSRGVIQGA